MVVIGQFVGYCRGDKKLLPATQVPSDSPILCAACRYIRDALSRQSKIQNCVAWFDEVFSSEEKTYTVIESYRLHRKNCKYYAGSLRTFPVLEIKSVMLKESGTDWAGEGELMNKRRWIQWSTDSFVCKIISLASLLRVVVCLSFMFVIALASSAPIVS